MLRVKTKIGLSKIDGVGLFANQFIPKGTTTWQHDHEFDISFDESVLERIPEHVKDQFMKYAYFDYQDNKYILCSDDQRFINYSRNPNIDSTPNKDIAIRDIEEGEELTCDYTAYEKHWFERRGLKKEEFK